MPKSCCLAVVLAVIYLSVILLSLEADRADAQSTVGKTSSKVRGSSTVDKVLNMVKVVASNQQRHAKEIKSEIREVKKMKDEMEEVAREIKDEISNKMDALRDEIKDVKRLLALTPKQQRVSALVCE